MYGTRQARGSELLSGRTWRITRGHVGYQNRGIHHGNHHTSSQQMLQYKRPEASNNPHRAVKSRWKQVDLISRLSDFCHLIDSDMSLVHVHGHQNSGRPASTLTPLAYLNIQMDAISEQIISEFLLSSAKINTMAIGILEPHVMPSVLIHGDLIHYNITQSITYEISKLRILQHWDNWNLTHTANWENRPHAVQKSTGDDYHPHCTIYHKMHE